jgi:hypothetical protein
MVYVHQASEGADKMSEIHDHEARCLRCGRKLTAPASIKALYGRGCRAIIRAAAIAKAARDFTTEQIDKARELIADGGLVATRRAGIYRAVSSRGDVTYLSHSAACNCPGGLRASKPCYHVAAVRILTAAKAA